ncbi:MAG: PAS domain-containing protein, partial [Deltaproteobacteria bacterium]|nr:PAS domain-containing protein [Deltaproteobacteria bacterium]
MAVDARLRRAQRKIEILEKMIENRTREVFVEQAQMRKTRDYFASIVESVQNALIVLNEKLEIVSVNSAAVHLLEASRTALAGSDFQQYLGEEKLVDALTGTLFGETILQREAKLKNSNGVLLPVLFSATLLKSDDLAGT